MHHFSLLFRNFAPNKQLSLRLSDSQEMKQIKLWMLTTILILSGLTTLTSCSNDDNGIVEPVGQVLQDGEWTGTGEGRSESIVVKVVV